MNNNYDNIIWIILFFVFLIIIGLYISEFTPLNLDEKKKALELDYITETFSPSSSSTTEQSEGASHLFKWGLPKDNDDFIKIPHEEKCKDNNEIEKPEEKCIPVNPTPTKVNELCTKCDITVNKDIDKYVLKNSIPPCPDMSKFVTKNMMNSNPDLNDYILKSEIKPCEKIDISQYLLKSEIPACPTCPICPECPICPICPEQQKCKEINEYNIIDHPDISKYISINDVNKDYIKKDDAHRYCKDHERSENRRDNKHEQRENKRDNRHERHENKRDENGRDSNDKSKKIEPNDLTNGSYKKYIDKLYEEDSYAKQFNKDQIGYYAGDSLFAAV